MDDRKELQQIQEYLGNTLSSGLQTSYSARSYEACCRSVFTASNATQQTQIKSGVHSSL